MSLLLSLLNRLCLKYEERIFIYVNGFLAEFAEGPEGAEVADGVGGYKRCRDMQKQMQKLK